MPIAIINKTPLPRINLLIRLTPADTKFLASRINEAIEKKTGANFILENLAGAACLINSEERGKQISLNAYTDTLSYKVTSQMRGYNGPWTHIEFVMDPRYGKAQLNKFIQSINLLEET